MIGCQACCNRGLAAACTYEASASIWDQDRERYIEQLERRLALLENTTGDIDAGHREPKRPRLARSDSSQSQEYISLDEFASPRDHADGFNDRHHVRDGSRSSDGRRGLPRDWASINGAPFVELLSNIIKEPHSSISQKQSSSFFENRYFVNLNRIFDSSLWPPKEDNFLLPSRKIADSLLDEYFRTLYLTLPVLDPKTFYQTYERLWTLKKDEKTNMSTFFCLLNLIFAISANAKQDLSPGQKSQAFLNRARNLIHVEDCREGGRELLQVLLLTAQSFESKNELQLARAASECAIDVARYERLNLHDASESVMDLSEKELMRRLWHSCVVADRQSASSLGIPTSANQTEAERVPFPQVHDVAYRCDFAPAKSQRQDTPSPVFGLFVLSIRLSSIVEASSPDETLLAPGQTKDMNINKIANLDQALTRWLNCMPEHLRKSAHGSKLNESNHAFQANFLRQRYLHARLLLYRSCFVKFIATDKDKGGRNKSVADSTNSSLSPTPPRFPMQSRKRARPTHGTDDMTTSLHESTTRVCAILCAQAAKEIVELIHIQLVVKRAPTTLSAWWDNVVYVHDAAAILMSSQISPTIAGEIGHEIIRSALKHCYSILHKSIHLGEQSQKSLESLEFLREQLEVEPIEHGDAQDDPDRHENHINVKDAAAYAAALDSQGRRVSAPATVIGPHVSSVQNQYGYVFAQTQPQSYGTPRQTAPPSLPATAGEHGKPQYPHLFPISPPTGAPSLGADMSSSLPTPVTTTSSQGQEYMTHMTTPQDMSFSWFDECNNINVPFDFQFPTPVSTHPPQPPTNFSH
ncbi:MAG: hypothetical protein M1831_005936 [Alyxoria varia]|nr:MAG: hypothetical protein M1831_005936 [Alyxoria varia]